MGHEETLRRIDRTAAIAHAPFLDSAASLGVAAAGLSRAVDVLLQSLALSRAMNEMKSEHSFDSQAFAGLKGQRDALDRFISSGEIWSEPATVH
jgi:DNA primase